MNKWEVGCFNQTVFTVNNSDVLNVVYRYCISSVEIQNQNYIRTINQGC